MASGIFAWVWISNCNFFVTVQVSIPVLRFPKRRTDFPGLPQKKIIPGKPSDGSVLTLFSRRKGILSQLQTFIVALAAASILTSCITTLTEPLALSFEEKLVVRGVIEAGKPIGNIAISRLLPALNTLSDSSGAVYDAVGTLSVNERAFRLTLQNSTKYGQFLEKTFGWVEFEAVGRKLFEFNALRYNKIARQV